MMTVEEIKKEIERLRRWIFMIEMADRMTWEDQEKERECERKIEKLTAQLVAMV